MKTLRQGLSILPFVLSLVILFVGKVIYWPFRKLAGLFALAGLAIGPDDPIDDEIRKAL